MNDGKFAKIDNKEKIDLVIKTHALIKEKKQKFDLAAKGSETMLKSVLEGIHNYEGVLTQRTQQDS